MPKQGSSSHETNSSISSTTKKDCSDMDAESQSAALLKVHGDGNCHICGYPKRYPHKNFFCSYPHGMLPVAPILKDREEGFWSWE